MTSRTQSPDAQSSQITRLQQFFAWLLPMAFILAVVELISFAISGSVPLAITGMSTLSFAFLVLWARSLIVRSALGASVTALCAGIWIVDIIAVFVLPAALPTLAVAPLL